MFSSVYPIQAPSSSGTEHVHAKCHRQPAAALRPGMDRGCTAGDRAQLAQFAQECSPPGRAPCWPGFPLATPWVGQFEGDYGGRSRTRRGETALVWKENDGASFELFPWGDAKH